MRTLLVGIDPDKGYAERLLDSGTCQRIISTDFTQLWSMIQQLSSLSLEPDFGRIVIFLEAPYLNRTLNASTLKRLENGPNGKILTPKGVAEILDVGRNLAKAELLRDFIRSHGGKCELVESRPNLYSFTKISEREFKGLGYYTGTTSEHGRDAAMLIHPINRTFGDWCRDNLLRSA